MAVQRHSTALNSHSTDGFSGRDGDARSKRATNPYRPDEA